MEYTPAVKTPTSVILLAENRVLDYGFRMSFYDAPIMKMLGTRMAYESERQAVLTQNLANIDTPGYKPRDLEPLAFKDLLVGGAQRLPMATTSPAHIGQPGGLNTQFNVISQAQSFETKPIGNAVSLEEQMANMAANQNDFQLSTTVYQNMITLFKTALGPNA